MHGTVAFRKSPLKSNGRKFFGQLETEIYSTLVQHIVASRLWYFIDIFRVCGI